MMFLFVYLNRERSVAVFLDSSVDFLQCDVRQITRGNDVRDGLFHGLTFVDEVFRRVVHLLPLLFPELVRFFFKPIFAVNEIYAEFHGGFRWHVVLYLKSGNILRLHANHLVLIHRWLGAFWQAIWPAPLQGPFAIRLQREFAPFAE